MITRAGPAHPFVLAAIHAAAFPPGEAWSVTMFAAQLGLPGVTGLLDEAGGMVLLRVAADEAEILTLGVAPAARRHASPARPNCSWRSRRATPLPARCMPRPASPRPDGAGATTPMAPTR
jgi:hypothetical protein